MSSGATKSKSAEILNQIERQKSHRGAVKIDEEQVKLVIFTLAGNFYAFFGDAVKEILPLLKINFVPGAPQHILGIVNVRGDIESVLDAHGLLGLDKPMTKTKTRIVIAEKNHVRSGVLVDSVEDVVDVRKSAISDAVSTLNKTVRNFVAGQANYRSHNVTVLDVGKIFDGSLDH